MNDHEDTNGSKESFREQDIYLPIANVARIMKNAIPQTGKVMQRRNVTRLYFSGVKRGKVKLREHIVHEWSELLISVIQPFSRILSSVVRAWLLSSVPISVLLYPPKLPLPHLLEADQTELRIVLKIGTLLELSGLGSVKL